LDQRAQHSGGPSPNEIAELRHRDASKGESRRIVAQGDPLQRAGDHPPRVHVPRRRS
jgi:hypothetical protein